MDEEVPHGAKAERSWNNVIFLGSTGHRDPIPRELKTFAVRMENAVKQFQPCFAIQGDSNRADLPEAVQSVSHQSVQLFSGAVQICGFHSNGQ